MVPFVVPAQCLGCRTVCMAENAGHMTRESWALRFTSSRGSGISGVMHEELFARGGLSLERLRTFCAIVHAGGIAAGAGDDPVRQSQFSRQLRELERFFGAELLIRGRGPGRTTPAGAELLEIASRSLASLEEFLIRIRKMPVSLRIGAGESLIQWWLLPRLPRKWSARTAVTPVFENRRNREIVDGLLDGSLDAGIISRPIEDDRLAFRVLAPLRYRLFVPRSLLPDGAVDADRLPDDLPLAELAGSRAVTEVFDQEWRRRGSLPRRILRLSSYPQLAAAVLGGHAAAVLPDFVEPHLADGSVCSVAPAFLGGLKGELRLAWNPAMLEVRPAVSEALPVLVQAWSGEKSPARALPRRRSPESRTRPGFRAGS